MRDKGNREITQGRLGWACIKNCDKLCVVMRNEQQTLKENFNGYWLSLDRK